MHAIPTPAQLNKVAKAFWTAEAIKFEHRVNDRGLMECASKEMHSEAKRLPIYYQRPLELLLQEAQESRCIFMVRPGAGGGKKCDALQKIIERLIEKNPNIGQRALQHQISRFKGHGIIDDVTEEEVVFTSSSGITKRVPNSALKDRLSRAKKKYSRMPGKCD